MNAAHASERALERAAPNSKVGTLARYRDAVEAEMELGATRAEAHETVASEFENVLNGIAELGEDAVNELGDLLGIDEKPDDYDDKKPDDDYGMAPDDHDDEAQEAFSGFTPQDNR